MVNRSSSLAGHYPQGHHGREGPAGVILCEIPDLVMQQVAAWPETLSEVGEIAAQAAGLNFVPGPSQAQDGRVGSMLRVEPLKWWLYGVTLSDLSVDLGCLLDVSHARTHVRVSGSDAVT